MKSLWVNQIKDKVGERVELFGWVNVRRDHGKIIFIDLRDRSGIAQLVFVPQNAELYKIAETLRPEWVVSIKGEVAERPKGMENQEIETGKIEIKAEEVKVLSKSGTPPFPLDTPGHEIDEELRLKYRYLDLRRERLKKNLVLRHKVTKFMRDYLSERGFIEIETPILTKSTPEGARDYLVKSRIPPLNPGKFYALPQSPQQYKQLLMIAGLEKYFQIARCFRDEDTRGDRQPEFTQLDLEMSFIEKEDIFKLIENLYKEMIEEITPNKKITEFPFPRLTYKEVMEKYKTDKPDLRKDKSDQNELAFLFVYEFPMFKQDKERRWDYEHHPFTMMYEEDLKYLDNDLESYPKDREEREKYRKNPDRPLKKIRAKSYDLVLNGYELASGSIRINEWETQEKVFKALDLDEKDVKRKFGHLMEAFKYGVPPHGGIAPGIDRFVMVLANEPNIREVIAFPKTGDARDPMMESPSKIEEEQLKELGLEIEKEK